MQKLRAKESMRIKAVETAPSKQVTSVKDPKKEDFLRSEEVSNINFVHDSVMIKAEVKQEGEEEYGIDNKYEPLVFDYCGTIKKEIQVKEEEDDDVNIQYEARVYDSNDIVKREVREEEDEENDADGNYESQDHGIKSIRLSTVEAQPASSPSSTDLNQGEQKQKKRRIACTCSNCLNGDNFFSKGKKQHVCHIHGCNRVYGKTSHLRAHLRSHRGERPYVCTWPFCGKGFTRSDDLRRHERTHTGERTFQCNECIKKFSRPDHLSKHLKTHQKRRLAEDKDQDEDKISKGQDYPDTQPETEKKPQPVTESKIFYSQDAATSTQHQSASSGSSSNEEKMIVTLGVVEVDDLIITSPLDS